MENLIIRFTHNVTRFSYLLLFGIFALGCGQQQSSEDTIESKTPSLITSSTNDDANKKPGIKCKYTIIFSDPDCFGGCLDVLIKPQTTKENIYWIIQNIVHSKNKNHLNIAFWDSKKKFQQYRNDKPVKMYASFSTEPDQDALIAAGRRNSNVDWLDSKDFSYILVCPDGTTEDGRANQLY